MPRVARAKSSSGYYHVMARGSGGQLLFECGEDYAVFLESLGSCADEHSVSLSLLTASCQTTCISLFETAMPGAEHGQGVSGFKRFSKAAVDRCVGGVFSRLSDSEAHETAVRELDGLLPSELKALSRARRNELILKLKNAGLTIRQIERLTGIGRNIIARA